jgi:hypothetical protein
MRKVEWNTLKEWLQIAIYLIGVMMIYLMGSLAIISLLLVVFIVDIKENVGRILIKVGVFVSSNMRKVKDFLQGLGRNPT